MKQTDQNTSFGIFLKLGSHIMFALCGVQLKWLGINDSLFSVGMWAGFWGAIGCLIFLAFGKNLKDLWLKNKKLSLIFVPLNIGGFTFSFLSFSNLSLVSVTLIFSTVPIVVSFLSWLILKEEITRKHCLGILISIIGILILVMGFDTQTTQSTNPIFGMITAFICVLLFSTEIILMRYIGSRAVDNPIAIITYYYAGLSILSAILIPLIGTSYLNPIEMPLLISLGLSDVAAVGLGYLALIHLQASKASILSHTQLIWAAILDYFIFNISPTHETFIGAVFIIIGTSLSSHVSRKKSII